MDQGKGLLHREQEALHIEVEDRVKVLLGDLAHRGKAGRTGIREDDIELALLSLDECEEAAFVHELLRRRQTNTAIATSNECDSSFEFTYLFLLAGGAAPRGSRR